MIQKRINFWCVIKLNIKKHNPNWTKIPVYPYRTLIVGGSDSRKAKSLFNLISQQPDIDKIYLYDEDPYEAKDQFFINKRESKGFMYFKDSKDCIEYLNDMDGNYKRCWRMQS